MKSVHDVFLEIVEVFRKHHISYPQRQAEELLCDFLEYTPETLYEGRNRLFEDQKWSTCWEWVARRLKGEPLAYVVGKVEFYRCSFRIDKRVLIPRFETEILVDKIASCLGNENLEGKTLWDICCGSGCIGISLKKQFPQLKVYLSDYSQEILDLAAQNAKENAVEVFLLKGDLLAPFFGKKADYVVCNPPYISEEEYVTLERDVKEYEPQRALVGGRTGLEFYERLAGELPVYLKSHAKIWLEIGYQQGESVQNLFKQTSWKKSLMENDWAGHNRFFFLENE